MQWIELLAYSRLRGKMMDTCPMCSKTERSKPKKCFQCGGTYFEDTGGSGGGNVKTGAEAFAMLEREAEKQKQKQG